MQSLNRKKKLRTGLLLFLQYIHVWHSLLAWRCGICGSHCCCFESMNLFHSFLRRPAPPQITTFPTLLHSSTHFSSRPHNCSYFSYSNIGISNELSLFHTSRVGSSSFLSLQLEPIFQLDICSGSLGLNLKAYKIDF